VLAREVERYRERHTGPILRGASALFSQLTQGAWRGLEADFGESDEPVLSCVRANGERVGVAELRSFRPLPLDALRDALDVVESVAVLDRADSPGGSPPLFADVVAALHGGGQRLESYVYGLGGRDMHPEDVRAVFAGTAARYIGLRGAPCPA
jgi:hypothetical protein